MANGNRPTPLESEYMHRYQISKSQVRALGAEHLAVMTEDARLVLTNKLKRDLDKRKGRIK